MTLQRQAVQYGLWPSPMQPQHLAEGLRLTDVAWDSDGKTLVWHEGRSDRGVLVCLAPDGDAPRDLTTDLSVRARVGYGGGDFSVAGGDVYFVDVSGRLYRQSLASGPARPLTPAFGYAAAPSVSPNRQWVVFVHTYEDQDCLALVDTAAQQWPWKLVTGADFYMQPCWHPQGDRLAWVAWHHPHMPWEGSLLQMGTVQADATGRVCLVDTQTLAGSDTVGIFQPTFSPDGRFLAYISNQSGWEDLYLYDLQTHTHRCLLHEQGDLGQPAWLQGMRTFGFGHNAHRLYYVRNDQGFRRLWSCDLASGACHDRHAGLEAYTSLDQPTPSPAQDVLACIASGATQPPRIITVQLEGTPTVRICKRATAEQVSIRELSTPQAITWATISGATVYGLYYAPSSTRYHSASLPPALLLIHGGPTAQAVAGFQPTVQFFTTRGYAVLQVNYRGSTGYGKAYVDALRGAWGVADVDDVVSGARFLIHQGWVDADKLILMGGSAGGYTVLQVLIQHPEFFKAALCLYGISNLLTLASSTHKFEAHYLDSLIGPLPQATADYRARSPLFHAERIRDPIAVFQGEDDQVVPKEQAEAIVASLRQRGVPHAYHLYPGEGHGWRRADTIAKFYASVEAFLQRYVLFG
jgi:dipeptidyl aminopeptidase/acylaminoacyl peptidase